MARKQFYKVVESAYIFPSIALRAGDQNQPEEPVRQWCLYELMRAYGIMIGEIEIERQVRVGSKNYRIDILVLQRGVPWAVFECKKPDFKKASEGMAQAISYADGQGIRADFAVYTNGEDWMVKRRVGTHWIAVPDLPQRFDAQPTLPLFELLHAIHCVSPLIYKLDEKISDKDARKLLYAMGTYFRGNHLLTQDIDRGLIFAADNLTRVLTSRSDDFAYQFGKLSSAVRYLERFREAKGFKHEIYVPNGRESINSEIQFLHGALVSMIDGMKGLTLADSLMLNVIIALLDYGRFRNSSKSLYPEIGSNLHHALREFLKYSFAVHLNAELPETNDSMALSDIKTYCHSAWDEVPSEY